MKLVSFVDRGQTRLGAIVGDRVVDLHTSAQNIPRDLRLALNQGLDASDVERAAAAPHATSLPLAEVEYAPVIRQPGKVICLGLNYADHAKEGGREKPSYPWFFLRSSTSLAAHQQPVAKPRVSDQLDYEAELAVVIGRRVRHAGRETALQAVFGYTCFNDISVRDYQRRTPQWTIGKNFDATGVFGPSLVTAGELPPGGAGLAIQARLNGLVVQDANTEDMLFDVEETIVLLSECMTLEPGDVLVMGTPSGVGAAQTPPTWMKTGDLIEVEIEGIGCLSNRIVSEP